MKLSEYKKGEAFRGKVPKDQAHKMALLWGEGSSELTELIEYCINNNIVTSASCRGHIDENGADAYIMFGSMPKEFVEHMVSVVEENKELNAKMDVSRFGDHKPEFGIHANSVQKRIDEDSSHLFKTILEGVQAYKMKEDRRKTIR